MQHRPPRPLLSSVVFILLLLLGDVSPPLGQSPQSESAPLHEAIRQLADRVLSIRGLHGPMRIEFFENAAFLAESNKEWQQIVQNEFDKRHLTLTQDPGATLLRIGLAETPTQMVLSAAVHTGEKDEVRLVTLPRVNFRRINLPVVPVRIEKQLLYETSSQILDAASLWNGGESGLVVLNYQGGELSVVRLDGAGTLKQTVSFAAVAIHASRDLRAELTLRAEDASITLPGKSCQFTWAGPLELKCRSANSAWRNGTVLMPSCDAGGWKLQADGTDWTTSDLLQLLPVESLRKGSAGLFSDFPGPILSINGEQNPASALVVTRNLRTGNYEVYRVTLVCGS